MEVYVSPALAADLAQRLDALYAVQTAPFQELVGDYTGCLRHNRELEVRSWRLCLSWCCREWLAPVESGYTESGRCM